MPAPEVSILAAEATVAALLRHATARLRLAGIEEAAGDARRLVAAAAGLTAAELLARPEQAVGAEQVKVLEGYLGRRATREPVARLLGEREFYGRSFVVSPATLEPRPDSETLISAALALVGVEGLQAKPVRILDVGTGTGCLLLTLLCELPLATGLGTDASQPALATARANAHRLGVAARAAWRTADGLEGIEGPFDLLVCNPPYVRTGDIPHLQPEVRAFDPRPALDGGPDGLTLYRRMAPQLAGVVPDGWVLFEVGYDQADDVAALLAMGLRIAPRRVRFYPDVTGKRRCVAARTRN
jgi:release factor glutamine methyltransferase